MKYQSTIQRGINMKLNHDAINLLLNKYSFNEGAKSKQSETYAHRRFKLKECYYRFYVMDNDVAFHFYISKESGELFKIQVGSFVRQRDELEIPIIKEMIKDRVLVL